MVDGASVTIPPQVVLEVFADFDALRASDSDDNYPNDPVYVRGEGTYFWDPLSTDADNGSTVIRPTDRSPLQAGRWVLDLDAGSGGLGGAENKAAAAAAAYPEYVMAVQVLGYYAAGDLGKALYRRKTASPGVAPSYSSLGWFQSADGAYWEIAEPVLNPYMFGAKGDDTGINGAGTNDVASFNAMFRMMEARQRAYPVTFAGGKFAINNETINLPRLGDGDEYQPIVTIDGGGARLRTNTNITIMGGVPANQAQALQWIDGNRYSIRNISFFGTQTFPNQIGLHLAASYLADVSEITCAALSYGMIATFCLEGKFSTVQAVGNTKRGIVLQSGAGYDDGAVWPDAVETGSASNVCTLENCRVFGRPGNLSTFGIFASDAVELHNCVSEGGNNATDIHFDYQGSGTVKRFRVIGLHCEAFSGTLNFKLRATGTVEIVDLVRSYPAQLFDTTGSTALHLEVNGLTFLGNMPAGQWLKSADGAGASGSYYSFVRCADIGAITNFTNPAKWGGTLPNNLYVQENAPSDAGVKEFTRGRRSFEGAIVMQGSTPAPAGGSTTARLLFGSANDFGIYFGSGAPTVTAGKGSWYMRTDGTTTNDRMYINTNGTNSWTAVTTAS